MIEVELKCELSAALLPTLKTKLQHLSFAGSVHNIDTYYDTSDYQLLRQAVFVRIRNRHQLDFKFNEQVIEKAVEHGQSTERSFPLEPTARNLAKMNALFVRFLPDWLVSSTVTEAITRNHLIELARIENRREEYAGENIYVSLDHVEGLGDFLEVETQCKEGSDTREAEALLQDFVADLHVQHIHVGYVELWLYKHNLDAYQLGRYHLREQ